MLEIEPPDSHHLSAALGWLELGNLKEAQLEWNRIAASYREHPDVLEVAWQIHAVEKDWPAALKVAEKMVQHAPLSPAGWICQSYTLHELKRTQEAWNHLLPMAEKFPAEGTIPFNLACYACQLGQLDAARKWLTRAVKIKPKFKQMALTDADLKPLRSMVEEL